MHFEKLPEIISMTDMIFDSYWALEFHKCRNHELLHVINGAFVLEIEKGQKFHAVAGDTLIVPEGTSHRDVFELNEDLEIFIIHFNWDLFDKYHKTVSLENISTVSADVQLELKRIFDQMRFDVGYDDLDLEIANILLMTALLLIYRGIISGNDSRKVSESFDAGKKRRKKLVTEAKRYIDKNFRNPLQLIDVAEHLQVSPFYLSRIFTRESDFSLVDYLADVRINTAKSLLQDGRYIVADVARMVGYQDGNYFSKVFKRRVGCSPTKYR